MAIEGIIEQSGLDDAVPVRRIRSRKQLSWLVGMHIAAVVALFVADSWWCLVAVAIGHLLTAGFGITLGYHRMLAHRAIDFRSPWDRVVVLLGVLSFQGGPLRWAALHRAHHRYDDRPGDPHSAQLGFYWAHMGWVYHLAPNGFRFRRYREKVADLSKRKWLVWFDDHDLAINLVAFVITTMLFGPVLSLSAFPLRIVLVWHTTWLVNSIGHGKLPWSSAEVAPRPANLPWLTWLTYGESLHANHHRYPSSPTFRTHWWHWDPGYQFFRALQILGVADTTRSLVRKARERELNAGLS